MTFRESETVDFEQIASRAELFPWSLTTPLVPGEELQTYRINVSASAETSVGSADTRHVLLRPTDTEGADFEIESVRLIFRKEHLASIPSGVGWQGLGEIYRESIVSRSPETLRFALRVPENAFLDLALGTVEDGPVTFKVAASDLELERTLTTPNRWEELTLDLAPLAGREISLSLSLQAENEGMLGFWGAPAVRSRGASSSPRGVVLFLLDTVRRDRLTPYGFERETAPHLSRLAAEGVLFGDAIAQGAWTKVSVPSILTSTYPTSNGIYELNHRMAASGVTLAEAFREAGYSTWASSSGRFTGRGSNLHQGVEVLHEAESLPDDRRKNARDFVDRFLPWLEAHHDVPFFAMIHAIDPHDAYEPNRPYDTLWAEPDAKKKHEEWTEKVKPFIESTTMKNRGLPLRGELEKAGIDPDEFVKIELDWYDGSIKGADVELGRVLEKLDELGIAEDTLVVFLSDHGEEFLDHGGHFHEENVYGELVNVPLAMRWPGALPVGRVVEETVQLLDLAPTILDLAGLAVPERMQGQSLKPLLAASGETERWRARPAISEWRRRTDQLGTRMVDAFSIIEGEWKLVRNVDRPEDVPEFELYHHETDPLDQKNVASENPEVVERLRQQLEGWHRWALENKLPSDGEAVEAMTSEELQRLRSLGYVQ